MRRISTFNMYRISSSSVSSSSRFKFRTRFEEKKICEYLANTIRSDFSFYQPFEVSCFSSEVLGDGIIASRLRKCHIQLPEDRTVYEIIEEADLRKAIPRRAVIKCLREGILPILDKKLRKLDSLQDDELQGRLLNLQKTFKLADEDAEILFFYYLLCTSSILENYFADPGGIISFTSYVRFRNYGHLVLSINRHALARALSKGTLQKLDLLGLNESRSFEMTDWVRDYLSGIGKSNLQHRFFARENDGPLDLSDFELYQDELLILNDLLKGGERCNILFYGAPGTGKSSLAKTLAKTYGKELLSVKIPEDDEHRNRLQAIHATINLSDRNSSIILIDEADDILNTFDSFFFKGRTNKSWINNLLDGHDKKIIWITNRSFGIETSTMRRFSFSMEFKKFTEKNRIKILQHEIKKRRLEGFFSNDELSDLCKSYSVDASGIINAITICKINRSKKKETLLKKMKAVLKSHEKATNDEKVIHSRKKVSDHYSIEGLNTSHNLNEIGALIKRYIEENTIHRSLSLLLYGLPGTGKTEYVHYLGNLLGKEVVLKMSSEIKSMYVGETEKNIAHAFQEAQEDNNILFFDEADTFLYPRSSAERSWEISFTNEILAQLDSYSGLVVFATNDIDGLDHAALRRFKFKIEFRPLAPEGNLHFFNKLLKPLVSGETALSAEQVRQLRSIQNLTPGDFAVVKDQFLFVDSSSVTYQKLIEALRAETIYKRNGSNLIGFERKAG